MFRGVKSTILKIEQSLLRLRKGMLTDVDTIATVKLVDCSHNGWSVFIYSSHKPGKGVQQRTYQVEKEYVRPSATNCLLLLGLLCANHLMIFLFQITGSLLQEQTTSETNLSYLHHNHPYLHQLKHPIDFIFMPRPRIRDAWLLPKLHQCG